MDCTAELFTNIESTGYSLYVSTAFCLISSLGHVPPCSLKLLA